MGAFEFIWAGTTLVIPALVAGALVMVNPPNEDFRRARYSFWASAALGIIVAAMWGAQSPLAFWARGFVVCIAASAIALGLMSALRWVRDRETSALEARTRNASTTPSPPTTVEASHPNARAVAATGKEVAKPSNRLVVECDQGLMPHAMPASGRFYAISVFPTPLENGGGGHMTYSNKPGADLDWGKPFFPAIRCQVVNYTRTTLINVEILLTMKFWDVIKEGNSMKMGALKLERPWRIVIPRLDPGEAGKFEVFMYNGAAHVAQVEFPTAASGLPIDGDEIAALDVVKTSKAALILWPEADLQP